MARPHIWPSAPDETSAAAPEAPAPLDDLAALAAGLGPELTRLFGLRTSARAAAEAGPGTADDGARRPQLLVARLRPAAGGTALPLELLASAVDIGLLLELLFGGRPTEGGAAPALPPHSASWATLSRFLGQAVVRALAVTGGAAPFTVVAPATPAVDAGPPPPWRFSLDLEGARAVLGLRAPRPRPPAPPAPDPAQWRQRALERTLDLALPVALKLAELRLPLAEVSALRPGAILPLERPETVRLLVGGQPFAEIAAEHFHPASPPEGEQP